MIMIEKSYKISFTSLIFYLHDIEYIRVRRVYNCTIYYIMYNIQAIIYSYIGYHVQDFVGKIEDRTEESHN